jgi:16S rRNA (guanine527-N7)-methyltransferase
MFTEAQRNRLQSACAQIGLDANDELIGQFETMAGMLLEWNQKINLTGLKTVDEVLDKHFIDSLYGHPHVAPTAFVLDIGTGAGFPGLPLKLAAPGRRVLMIDGTGKKIQYVNEVIKALGLKNASAMHQRAEDQGFRFGLQGQVDVVTARAVAATKELVSLGEPFLKKGGKMLLYKGVDEAEAMAKQKFAGFAAAVLHRYELPAGDKRALLELIRAK